MKKDGMKTRMLCMKYIRQNLSVLFVLKKVTPNPSTSSAADTQCKRPSPPKITLAVWKASLQSDWYQ